MYRSGVAALAPAKDALAARRCGIYVVDVEKEVGNALPPRYRPVGWGTNKFSAELWLRRAVEHHPWRVYDPLQADVVLLSANFSLYCRAGKSFTGRAVWKGLVQLLGHSAGSGRDCHDCKPLTAFRNGTAKFITLTNNECKAPWTGAVRPKDIFQVTDQKPGAFGVLAPFVVSRPAWLTGSLPLGAPAAPRRVPWDERKLLFFLGHVPKLYIEPTRHRIWSQVRRLPQVTALSGTLNCSVGQFSACRQLDVLSDEQLRTYCYDFCREHAEEGAIMKRHEEPGMRKWRKAANGSSQPVEAPVHMRCKSRSSLKRYCKSHKHVNFSAELPDMAAAARKLPQREYFDMAMGHRFCLAAPGDFISTPKITEFVALGAAGGCLPVLVIKGEPHNTLPYMRWLDWCSIAWVVNTSRTRHGQRHEALTLTTDPSLNPTPTPTPTPTLPLTIPNPDQVRADARGRREAARRYRRGGRGQAGRTALGRRCLRLAPARAAAARAALRRRLHPRRRLRRLAALPQR